MLPVEAFLAIPVSTDNDIILSFRARKRQALRAVPFSQPTLMLILQGQKHLHSSTVSVLKTGTLLLVPAGAELTFTNEPDEQGHYQAWVIPLPASDIPPLPAGPVRYEPRSIDDPLSGTLIRQIAELSLHHPVSAAVPIQARRRELAQHLCQLGYGPELRSGLMQNWSHRCEAVLRQDLSHEWTLEALSKQLAVSASTLRRKLAGEQQSFRGLLSQLRLVQGLNLLQTRPYSIQHIADACGYRSTARFSERFRARFGVTPSELRQQQELRPQSEQIRK